MKRFAKAFLVGMGRSIDLFGAIPATGHSEAEELSRATGLPIEDCIIYLDWKHVGDDLRHAMIDWKAKGSDVEAQSGGTQASA